jgi:hypothetical protein
MYVCMYLFSETPVQTNQIKHSMQGITKALRLHGRQLRHAVLQHMNMNKGIFSWATLISRIQSESPAVIIPHMGLENITVNEILRAKGEAEAGAVYWCSTGHLVHEAVQHVKRRCRSIRFAFFFLLPPLPLPRY